MNRTVAEARCLIYLRSLLSSLVCAIMMAGCGSDSAAQNGDEATFTKIPTGILEEVTRSPVREQSTETPGQLFARPLPPGVKQQLIGAREQRLLLLELDSSLLEPVLIGRPQQGISALDALAQQNLSLVVGSGFVSELHSLQPVGLLQVNGQTLNPVQGHGYTRIVGVNDLGMGVVHKEAYHRDLFHSALQLGPGIIEQGRLDISERDFERPRYYRSFIAVCDSRWLAGVSLSPTHLRTLGQILVDYFAQQNWHCPDVVNLAGDRQAVLLVKTASGQTLFHGDPDTHKVSLFGFRAKASASARTGPRAKHR